MTPEAKQGTATVMEKESKSNPYRWSTLSASIFSVLITVAVFETFVTPKRVAEREQQMMRDAVKTKAGVWHSDGEGAPRFAWVSCIPNMPPMPTKEKGTK